MHTIAPASSLPAITETVVIDGYTQPGSSPNTLADAVNAVLLIEFDRTDSIGPTLAGAGASGSTIRGLVVNRVTNQSGIVIFSGATNCVIEGNFVGTDPTGMIARGNPGGQGIRSFGGSGHRFGGLLPEQRNVISGNTANGLEISDDNDVVQGNFIGVDVTGATALPNGPTLAGNGVRLDFNGSGNLIGGTAPGARNIISGNAGDGVIIISGTSSNIVQGNFIGTDSTGTQALGNAG